MGRLLAGAARAILGDDGHHLRRLLAAHHTDAVVRPGEDEARPEGAPAHAVIARAERGADMQRDLGHRRIGHGLDHLGAMLDDPAALRRRPHDVARRILQEDQRRAALRASLHELRGLGRTVRIDRPVIADDPDLMPLDPREAGDRRRSIGRLEVQPVAAVDDPRDHLTHIIGLAIVRRHDAENLFRVVEREGRCGGRGHAVPFQLVRHGARETDRIAVVFRDPFGKAADRRMHLRPAQRLVGRNLARRGLQQRRPGEEDLGLPPHDDHVVAEPRLIRPARGR